MNYKNLIQQFGKFAAIGLSSTAINYAVFFVGFKIFGVFYAWAHVAGYITGVLFGYFFNRSWTFDSVAQKRHREFILYLATYIISLVISVAVLQILVEQGGLNPLLANLISIGFSMATNFLGLKLIVFNQRAIDKINNILHFFTPAFYTILAIKILASFALGSHYLTEGFLPFVKYFSQTLQNPYQYFYSLKDFLFPYPGGMLSIVSLPFIILSRVLPHQFFTSLNWEIFVLRLPTMLFDVVLYIILCLLLPTKEKKVLWLYFASPLLFYINYYHGQLDVIPTAVLFASLFLLLKRHNLLSFIMLGLGIATKTHLAAALPFYWLYLYRNNFGLKKIVSLSLSAIAAFFVLNPYLFSPGFIQTVFNNPEQQRIFALNLSFGLNGLTFFIAPAAIIFIMFKFAGYKKMNMDSLILTLGLTYIALIALVPPMQGWFYWSVPFLIFFFIKFNDSPTLPLIALNAAALIYFIFSKDSDMFESLAPLLPALSHSPNFYALLGAKGTQWQNLSFTVLEAVLIAGAIWAYGAVKNTIELYQKKKKRFMIGIAGDSGVGKTTLVSILEKIIGEKNRALLNGDDVHKWERHDPRWQAVTHLNPKGNKIHTDLEHAQALLKGQSVQRLAYDHASGNFVGPLEIKPNNFIIFQGLMPFLLDRMRELHDLKIYIETDEQLRSEWKTERDLLERGKAPADSRAQMENRKPDAEKFIHPQKDFADWIIRYKKSELGDIYAEYQFKNSLPLERLVEQLSQLPGLKIQHDYEGVNLQRVTLTGSPAEQDISQAAYTLFPNLFDLTENLPEFEPGLKGLHQIFFINYLDHYYRSRE